MSSRPLTTCARPAGIEDAASARHLRLTALLDRMQQGDRRAAALFIVENGDLIRRRFRRRISNSVRRLFDSQDLVSTLARRLDRLVHRRTLRAESVGEFWSLVMAMGRFSLSERERNARKRGDFGAPRGCHDRPADLEPCAGVEDGGNYAMLDRCLKRLNDDGDATVLLLRLGGLSHTHIAEHMGVSVEAARKRWERVRKSLRGVEDEQCNQG
jgi:DNA-directed RNA polymerase specialized sigma24 family protein